MWNANWPQEPENSAGSPPLIFLTCFSCVHVCACVCVCEAESVPNNFYSFFIFSLQIKLQVACNFI